MGMGVIVRDHEDNVLVTMSSLKHYIIDLVVTKTIAAMYIDNDFF